MLGLDIILVGIFVTYVVSDHVYMLIHWDGESNFYDAPSLYSENISKTEFYKLQDKENLVCLKDTSIKIKL